MNVQTLVVTIDRDDFALIDDMNVQTDAIVGNQCGRDEVSFFEHKGFEVCFVSSSTRGVGINRNEILMRANADLCVLADDDMVFLEDYESVVREWFERVPEADILVFNLQEAVPRRYRNDKIRRLNGLNYGKYGAARLAFRVQSIQFSGVFFHTMFGGGARYSCGEDTLFLKECMKKGLKAYAVPAEIARIKDEESTWFEGYTDKYFFDKGVLFRALNRRMCVPHALVHCIRHRKRYRAYGLGNAIMQMRAGMDSVK